MSPYDESSIDIQFSAAQAEALRRVAQKKGMTLEEISSEALVAFIEERYRLPSTSGEIVPFRGLAGKGSDEKG